MGTSLNGLTPATTYQGLIKFGDNSALTSTQRVLSDGNGNNMPISVGTNAVTISGASTGATPITLTVDNTLGYVSPYDQVIQKWISGGVQRAILWADGDFQSTYITSNSTLTAKSNTSLRNTTIKGTGTTSATQSLIVQNSSATEYFRINDDGSMLNSAGGHKFNYGAAGLGIGATSTGLTSATPRIFSSNTDNLFLESGNSSNAFVIISGSATHRIGINNASPSASAQLDIASTTRGFLPPRMTTAQKGAISSPVAGLMVFDTTLVKLCVYNGTAWETITSV